MDHEISVKLKQNRKKEDFDQIHRTKQEFEQLWPKKKPKLKRIALLRQLIWICLFFAFLVAYIDSVKSLNIVRINKSTPQMNFTNNADSFLTNTKKNDSIEKNDSKSQAFIENRCDSRVDGIYFYIIDGYAFKALIDFQKNGQTKTLIDKIKQNKSKFRLFQVQSEGILITKAALLRMFWGFTCSLYNSFDNSKSVSEFSDFSVFNEITLRGGQTKCLSPESLNIIFSKWNFNENVKDTKDIQNILKSIGEKSLTINHRYFYDEYTHIFGDKNEDTHIMLEEELKSFNEVIDKVDEINKRILFILVGDHGLIRDNHGNDTMVESNVPMIAYTNFEGLFTNEHWPKNENKKEGNDDDLNNYVFRANQVDISSTLSLLLGVNIPKLSEGIPIGEFFRDSNTGKLIDCYYDINNRHLEETFKLRIKYSGQSTTLSLKMLEGESLYKKNEKLSQAIKNITYNDVNSMKTMIIISTSLFILSILGNNIISIYVTLSFIICASLIIQNIILLSLTSLLLFILFCCILTLSEPISITKDIKSLTDKKSTIILTLKVLTIISSSISIISNQFSQIAIILTIIFIFIIPSILLFALLPFTRQVKAFSIIQYSFLIIILAITTQMSEIVPDFYDQIYKYYTVESIESKTLCFLILSFTFTFLYTGRSKNDLKYYYIVILISFLTLILITWTLRDVLNIYNAKYKIYTTYLLYAIHILAILIIIISIILAVDLSDIFIFYDLSSIAIVSASLATYRIVYCPIFISIHLLIRSIGSLPRFFVYVIQNNSKIQSISDFNLERKSTIFTFIIFSLTITPVFFKVLGRSSTVHNIYSISTAFQFALSEDKIFLASLYGSITTFSPLILVIFFVSFELIKYAKNTKNRYIFDSMSSSSSIKDVSRQDKCEHLLKVLKYCTLRSMLLFQVMFEALIVYFSSGILFISIYSYYITLRDPRHVWNRVELKIILLILNFLFNLVIISFNSIIMAFVF